MRAMFVCNKFVAVAPTGVGEWAISHKGVYLDLATAFQLAASDKSILLDFTNSLGNGSVRTFTVNPFDFTYRKDLSGTNVKNYTTVVFPTGSLPYGKTTVDGGIVIKQLDPDKNVYNTLKLIPVSVVTTLWSDVKTAIIAALAATGISSYFSNVSVTNATTSVYTFNNDNIYVEFVGDLKDVKSTMTMGAKEANLGTDAAKFERELAPNMGYFNTIDKFDGFNESNFIVDSSVSYNIIAIETKTEAQRPLIKGSDGFIKTLFMYFPKTTADADLAKFEKLIGGLVENPLGEVTFGA